MISMYPRPREGAIKHRSQILPLDFNPRFHWKSDTPNKTPQSINAILPRSNFGYEFTNKQNVLAFLQGIHYKKPDTVTNTVSGPLDGLQNKARPSVRGWKSSVFCKPRQWTIQTEWKINMIRKHSTTRTGGAFSAATIEAVWRKAAPLYGRPGYAKDQCGAIIHRYSYGTISDYGWEIDHVRPVSKGGSDALSNLQPLHWQNNRTKGANFPRYRCAVSA